MCVKPRVKERGMSLSVACCDGAGSSLESGEACCKLLRSRLSGGLSSSRCSATHRRGSWRLGVLQPDPTTPRQPLIKSRRGQQLCLSTLRRGNPHICMDRHPSAAEASIAHA
ncbi:hypothetical protein PIB30_070556 [Stylosanthes scabra]|uniref:Uncharacterized protein n=1 Tax=Stylosanthes scabra TaxID=79078 RepID=A0ABU6ZM77_9FABA|nr:hypothetical protein [Stylosanthes scabra]